MSEPPNETATPPPATEFLITKEHRRFAEFCDAVRRHRYIGVCFGPPGVGKTLSARQYTRWDLLGPVIDRRPNLMESPIVPEAALCRSAFFTAGVTATPKQLTKQLDSLILCFSWTVEEALRPDEDLDDCSNWTELLIVDEADRLTVQTLEQLRDFYDRQRVGGVILIGMPGLEKRLARYAQLYSRVGFVHQFRTLSSEEMLFILEHHWQRLGLTLTPDDFTDAEAIAAVIRITSGNFRLVQRLFSQIERVLQINELRTITKEVVEAARENLVIGPL
jgi:DNA transposition AAA+ family ATPase